MFEQNHFKSIDELVKFFPTEQSCIDFLEKSIHDCSSQPNSHV